MAPEIFTDADVQTPEPVSRYLLRALGTATTLITRARFYQSGELRTDPRSRFWHRFSGHESVDPVNVELSWNACVRIAPLIHLNVEDGYGKGKGSGRVSLLSMITLSSERGNPELNEAALLRFLAESPWYPSVLLPSARLRWLPLDGTRAIATLTDHGLTVELEFRFDRAGDVAAVYSPGRPRRTVTGYESTPWEGHFADYGERDGLRVPFRGEVGWYVDDGWTCVWRARIVDAQYERMGVGAGNKRR
jgi:hypothetical protein